VPVSGVELEELDELDELVEIDVELDEFIELEELDELKTLDEVDDPELGGSAPFPHAAISTTLAANAAAKARRLNMDRTSPRNQISPSSSIAD
jgi:hypothetical protein